MTSQPHILVSTHSELSAAPNKILLDELLEGNPHHTLLLDVEDSIFVQDGALRLYRQDMPAGIKHLMIINRAENITSFADNFLSSSWALRGFDTENMGHVTHLGDDFLSHCQGLQHFNPDGLTRLLKIGTGYLNYSGLTEKQMTHITQTLRMHIRANRMYKEEVPRWWEIMIQSISGTMEFIFCP